MNCPPLLMRLGIYGQRRRLSLWLPLFLLWPLAAAVAIVLAPLVLLAALILWPIVWGKLMLLSGPLLFRCLCALRGLELNLNLGKRLLLISFK
jgi:hypothetical protein